jgi:hypothetical protein
LVAPFSLHIASGPTDGNESPPSVEFFGAKKSNKSLSKSSVVGDFQAL